jgi:calcium-dependent protein kinase
MLRREVRILLKMDHPNIVNLFAVYEDTKYFHLLMNMCAGGELFDRIIE